jgi:AraC-like DNA-binding protein
MLKATTPAQYVLLLIDLVENEGADPVALLSGTSLARTGLAGIGARVGEHDFVRLVTNAFELTEDSALGLKLGLRLNLSAHAVMGQAFMTCEDLGQILALFMKYYHLLSPALYLEFETREDRCFLTALANPQSIPVEFAYEMVFGGILNTLQGMLNLPDLRFRVELPYPAPAHSDLYRETFGDEVEFNRPRGRISFDKALLDIPLPQSNPVLRALYEAECSRLLADLEEGDSITDKTLRLLRKLEGQYPKMPQIAQMLNLSPRTYRRRLEAERQSFQELLDQVRDEHATRYLQDTRLPLSSIAYLVGFNDASNFRRAYARWTGQSPHKVRNTH